MGAKVFDNPKDHEMMVTIRHLLHLRSPNNIILNSFAGSGTTGHSVLLQNSEDDGKRRFILVEMDNTIARTCYSRKT